MQTNFTLEHQYKIFLEKSKMCNGQITLKREDELKKHDFMLAAKILLDTWIGRMSYLSPNEGFEALNSQRVEAYRFLGLPTDRLEY